MKFTWVLSIEPINNVLIFTSYELSEEEFHTTKVRTFLGIIITKPFQKITVHRLFS